jgi:PAS domain S-box-containing protein
MFETLLSNQSSSQWLAWPEGLVWLSGALVLLLAAAVVVAVLVARRWKHHNAVLKSMLDISVEPVLTLDAQGRIRRANASTQRLFGYSWAEMQGQPLRKLAPALQFLDLEDVLLYQRWSEGPPGAGPGLEMLGQDNNGRTLNLYLTVHRVNSTDDAVYVVCLKDVSALKELQRRERLAHEDTQALLDALKGYAIVSETDAKGIIQKVNAAFVAVSGYQPGELLGHSHKTLSSGQHTRAFWEDVWMQLRKGKTWRGYICNRRKNGELYWVDSLMVPRMDATGNIERIVAVRQDVTTRVNREWLLDKSRRKPGSPGLEAERTEAYDVLAQHGQFVEIMSHELRTPLNAILGFGQLLEQDPHLRPEQVDHLREIMTAGRQLTEVVNEVIELSKGSSRVASSRLNGSVPRPALTSPRPGPKTLINATGMPVAAPMPNAPATLREPVVVYIDDNEVNLKLVAKVIGRTRNYNVNCFSNPVAGLAFIQKKPPDLVLLDIQMPQMSGFQVLESIRKSPRLHGLKVVALSANYSPEAVTDGLSAGFNGYLGKPILDYAAFLQFVDKQLGQIG